MGCRHSPWWWRDPTDITPQGEPETLVQLPSGDVLYGLCIRGLTADTMLGVRDAADGTLSCAVTNEIYIEHTPINVQSNPRRADEDDGA